MARAPHNPSNRPVGKKSRGPTAANKSTKVDAIPKLAVSQLEDRTVPAGLISGSVFEDFNANGVFDSAPASLPNVGAGQYGVATDAGWTGPAVTVKAFDAANALVGTGTSGTNGAYSFSVSGVGPYRVEFSNLPTGVFFGPTSLNTGTAVQFVNDPNGGTASGVNLALVRAENINSDNPLLVTNTYVFGSLNGPNGALPVVTDIPYASGSTTTGNTQGAGSTLPATHKIAIPQSQVGTTWGLAYDRTSNQLYMAAFQKRHADVGPGGYGAIYNATAPSAANGNASTTTATQFINLETLAPGSTGTNYRATAQFNQVPTGANVPANYNPTQVPFLYDGLYKDANGHDVGWDSVGKLGLGGLDVDSTGRFLFTVALGDRKLYVVDTVTKNIRSYDLPAPASLTGTQAGRLGDLRPFAVTYYHGQIYVGAINTAESTTLNGTVVGDRNALKGYVFQFDPGTNPIGGTGKFVTTAGVATTTQPVFEFDLNYGRGNAHPGADPAQYPATPISANWLPWTPTFHSLADRAKTQVGVYPQPWFTGLAFDASGNMVVGLRDRAGDQFGTFTPSDPANPDRFFQGVTAGDTLRAFGTTTAGWALESNGRNPNGAQASTNGQGTGQGPGGGEFYSGDYLQPGVYNNANRPPVLNDHDEVSVGGVLQLAGFPDAVSTVFDPAQIGQRYNAAGTRWFNNSTGNTTKAYELYQVAFPQNGTPAQFAKANGIGDLVAVSPVPVEIGNRVWLDIDKNGRQDPNEPGIAGVLVELLDANGAGIATATTDANGNYYFSTLGVPANPQPGKTYGLNLTPNTQYQIRILLAQAPISGKTVTTALATADNIDSNGVLLNGYSQTTLTTGPLGANNHTYDFGFVPPTFSIGDYVWRDLNADSMWQAGEPAIPGVRVDLLNVNGTVIATTTTNASGGYLFTGLAAGQYQVSIPINQAPLNGLLSSPGATSGNNKDHGTPTGAVVLGPVVNLQLGTAPTDDAPNPPSGLVDTAPNENSDRTQDFGFYKPTFSIGDYVWRDLNADGMWQLGDPAIAGVRVDLLNASGAVIATTTTNDSGGYLFTGLDAGQYQVSIPINQAPLNGLLSSPGATSGNNKDHGTPTGNAVLGPVVNLQLGTAPTDDAPNPPSGLVDTAPNENSDRTQDFGFYSPNVPPPPPPSPAPASVSGYVFIDIPNINGQRQYSTGERGIPGTRLVLDGFTDTGTRVPTRDTYTDANGFYQFLNLLPGTYAVREEQPLGTWYNGIDAIGTVGGQVRGTLGNDILSSITLNAGDAGIEYNFSELPITGTWGYVWVDSNFNGIRDAGEAPIPNVVVTISGTAFTGTVLERPLVDADVPGGLTQVTDSNGRYDFVRLPIGTYAIRETQPVNYDDFREQDGDPYSAQRPDIANDAFTNIQLGPQLRGPFNFGEGLSSSDPLRRRAPLQSTELNETSKRTFLGSSVDASGAGGTASSTGSSSSQRRLSLVSSSSIPDQVTPGGFSPVSGLPLYPQFNIGAADTRENTQLIVGSGSGIAPIIRVFDYTTKTESQRFLAFESSFTGGIRTASGDVNGDGINDIVAVVGANGGPRVRVFDGQTGAVTMDYFAYESTYTGGLAVAVGDINGDGFADIVTGTQVGGGPRVRIFSGKDGSILQDFFAFDSTQRGGVRLALADINGDGRQDIVCTTGEGVPTRVRVFDGTNLNVLLDFAPYEMQFTGGAYIAAGDVNGDGIPDIITGADTGGGPSVKVFSGKDGSVLQSFFAFEEGFTGGVRVAAADFNRDGKAEIVVGAGVGGAGRVSIFSGAGLARVDDFYAFDSDFTGGVFVATSTERRTPQAKTGAPVAAGFLATAGTMADLPIAFNGTTATANLTK